MDNLLDDFDDIDAAETDDKPTLASEFSDIIRNIHKSASGASPEADDVCKWESTLKKLNEECSWLPGQLETLPKDKNFEKFEGLLFSLIRICPEFLEWRESGHGETLLHLAVRKPHIRLINFLALHHNQRFIDVLAKPSNNNLRCLHLAVQLNPPRWKLVDFILRQLTNGTSTDPHPAKVRGTDGNIPLHFAVQFNMCKQGQTGLTKVVEILLQAAPDSVMEPNGAGNTPLQHYYKTREDYNNLAETDTGKDVVALLKLNCLRLDFDRETIRRVVYGKQPPREITFDLFGYKEIREDSLENLAGHIKFESILKSVALPELTVTPPEYYIEAKKEAEKAAKSAMGKPVDISADVQVDLPGDKKLPDCPGRIDYCWIFKWLRSHEVEQILRVSVQDRSPTPHSEESIEWSLRGMGVETLDWNKLDICCTTIRNAAPKVRDLTLYSSGNNAVLRGWSGPGGLAELPDLKIITLKIHQGLESLAKTEKNAAAFEKQLVQQRYQWCLQFHENEAKLQQDQMAPQKKGTAASQDSLPGQVQQTNHQPPQSEEENNVEMACPNHQIKILHKVIGSDGKAIVLPADKNIEGEAEQSENHLGQREEWLECIQKFRTFIKAYREDYPPGNKPRAITVALIDDGVDGLNAELGQSIEGGETFSKRSGTDYNSYFTSTKGHGTIMAMLIRKVCPNVRLYVVKLNELRTGHDTPSITAESAVDAIKWATGKGVDIISMSWTINTTADGELQKAIHAAIEAKILLFCSVSDQGPKSEGLYPANCSPSSSFLIGTATIAGQSWAWNGANDVDYIFPGTNLEVAIGDELFDRRLKKRCESGSSLATALAAGLAALVLDCVALNNAKELSLVKTHNGMKLALDAINTQHHNDKYIRVWETFDKDHDKSEKIRLRAIVDRLLSHVRGEIRHDGQKVASKQG